MQFGPLFKLCDCFKLIGILKKHTYNVIISRSPLSTHSLHFFPCFTYILYVKKCNLKDLICKSVTKDFILIGEYVKGTKNESMPKTSELSPDLIKHFCL